MHSIRCMFYLENYPFWRGHRGGDRMVVELLSNYAISADYQKKICVRIPLKQGVHDTTLCDKVVEVTCGRSVVFLVLRFLLPIKLTATV